MMDTVASPFVVIDVETTGLDPSEDRICEVGAIRFEGRRETGRYHSLVQPQRKIPGDAVALHGISDEMLRGAPTFARIAPDLRRFLAGTFLVAQNAEFDLSFLNAEFERAGMGKLPNPAVDTIALARRAAPNLGSYSLDSLARHFQVDLKDRHRSMGDCEATARVFLKCVDALRPADARRLIAMGTMKRPARRAPPATS